MTTGFFKILLQCLQTVIYWLVSSLRGIYVCICSVYPKKESFYCRMLNFVHQEIWTTWYWECMCPFLRSWWFTWGCWYRHWRMHAATTSKRCGHLVCPPACDDLLFKLEPKDLRYTFGFQKVLKVLDGNKLSSMVQVLKSKLHE